MILLRCSGRSYWLLWLRKFYRLAPINLYAHFIKHALCQLLVGQHFYQDFVHPVQQAYAALLTKAEKLMGGAEDRAIGCLLYTSDAADD